MYPIQLLCLPLSIMLLGLITTNKTTKGLNDQKLEGKWEVIEYSEQGVPVQKKSSALAQAIKVWQYNWPNRSGYYYGYNPDYDKKAPRRYEKWEEQDSIREVRRLIDAISTPYFAVFFADSTLALYNKDASTGSISFSETRRYRYNQAFGSFDITPGLDYFEKTNVQIIEHTENSMRLFIPGKAEIVVLLKQPFILP
jgi:hypothetical protein